MFSYNFQSIQSQSGGALFLVVAFLVFWLATLVFALKNKHLNDISRFMWVFVIVMVPILGCVLYLLMAPSSSGPVSLGEAAELEARRKMLGVYDREEWKNR